MPTGPISPRTMVALLRTSAEEIQGRKDNQDEQAKEFSYFQDAEPLVKNNVRKLELERFMSRESFDLNHIKAMERVSRENMFSHFILTKPKHKPPTEANLPPTGQSGNTDHLNASTDANFAASRIGGRPPISASASAVASPRDGHGQNPSPNDAAAATPPATVETNGSGNNTKA